MTIDFEKIPARERYRWMVASIVPRPIAFVSSISPNGITNLAPFSFFNGVCSDPPVITIAVTHHRGHEKDTLRNIEATKEFVVNIVGEDIAEKMVQCSGEYPYETSEFEIAGFTPVPSDRVAPPRVAECHIAMECTLLQVVRVGDPATGVVLGKIELLHADDEILTDGTPDPEKLRPFARLGADLYSSLGELRRIPRPVVPKS